MPSYLVTGVSRGLGFAFIRHLSEDPKAVVIGLARNKAATEKKVYDEIGRSNIHILQADLVDYDSLKKAVEETSKITGGSLDYLILNGATMGHVDAFQTLSDMGEDPKALEEEFLSSYKANVIGNVHMINLSLPLIRAGKVKKVIFISSGHGDYDLARDYKITNSSSYAMNKAAMNLAMVKYHGQWSSEGILFMSISPGVVKTGNFDLSKLSEKQKAVLGGMTQKFQEYAPDWKGPITPDESVKLVMGVINNASVERGDGGSFVSHHGTKKWL
ncbi:NAD(P)-binding protein [Rostrohypoxylon terebratum]|nr:NAD(P)-binding protein [Rostrohypoxylon terebratum]